MPKSDRLRPGFAPTESEEPEQAGQRRSYPQSMPSAIRVYQCARGQYRRQNAEI